MPRQPKAMAELVPSAARLMHSLRDIGYDLPSAVADLVDNSVDAGAERIEITFHFDGTRSWIRIADDGAGMTRGELDEAMRYGSRRSYGPEELGRFGLGLKTASLSQCRRLAVASRTTMRSRINIRRWDLDRVAATDSWVLEELRVKEAPVPLIEPLRDHAGTVVLWDRLDRIDAFQDPDGGRARAGFERDAKRVADHLGVVFHRYLAGETEGAPLEIYVNGERVEPWDPFAREEPHTQALRPHRLNGPGGPLVRPYILPPQHLFSSPSAHERAAGPKKWNRQQGLYIYRNNRMIQCGGWSRMRTADEHSKLARIAIDIPSGSESAWRLNVAKMSVSIPESVRAELKTLVSGVVAQAQLAYRSGGAIASSEEEPAPSDGWRLGDHWKVIARVLEEELGDDLERLDRILERLINSREVHEGILA
mgnify:CR=1 FL=1